MARNRQSDGDHFPSRKFFHAASPVQEVLRKVTTRHDLGQPGSHVIKIWMVDPCIVLQRVLLHFGDVPASYYGPTESVRR